MPLPAAVRAKLKPLILMLSSKYDGERAAAATIDKVLAKAGCDWHDFTAAVLADGDKTQTQVRPEPELKERPHGNFEIAATDLQALIAAMNEGGAFLSPKSIDFLDGLASRAANYTKVRLSPKQLAWLSDLLAKVPS